MIDRKIELKPISPNPDTNTPKAFRHRDKTLTTLFGWPRINMYKHNVLMISESESKDDLFHWSLEHAKQVGENVQS